MGLALSATTEAGGPQSGSKEYSPGRNKPSLDRVSQYNTVQAWHGTAGPRLGRERFYSAMPYCFLTYILTRANSGNKGDILGKHIS